LCQSVKTLSIQIEVLARDPGVEADNQQFCASEREEPQPNVQPAWSKPIPAAIAPAAARIITPRGQGSTGAEH